MSSHVKNCIGEANASNLLNFLRDHVFVHENYFAAYRYNYYRSFCDYSNTPLEGTNGGLKYGDFAVLPNMKISKSASFMICQDECKHNNRKRAAHENQFKTKLYNLHIDGNNETKRIVPKALGEMQQQIERGHSLCSLRLDASTWIVRTGAVETKELRILPQFLRFRYVRKDNDGGFTCTCPFTTMYGIVVMWHT